MQAFRTVGLAFLVLAAVSAPGRAGAEQPGPDWMPAEEVKKGLLAAGYSEITKLEADDNHWDGEGVKNGRKMTFDADPKTGIILGETPE